MADDGRKSRIWKFVKWGITVLATAFAGWLINHLSAGSLVGWIVTLYAAIGYPATLLPPWLLTCIVIVAVSLVAVDIIREYRRRQEPDVEDYTSTFLFGVGWVWDWNSYGKVIKLKPVCPECFHELLWDEVKGWVLCMSCGLEDELQDPKVEDKSEIMLMIKPDSKRVKQEIDKHCRTGEYKERVKEFEDRKEKILQKAASKALD